MAVVLVDDDVETEARLALPPSPQQIAPTAPEPSPTHTPLREVLNQDIPNTERYVVVATITDQRQLNLAIASLESNGVPVMVEHIHVRAHPLRGTAFRVLTPVGSVHGALGILGRLRIAPTESGDNEDDGATTSARSYGAQ